MAPFPSVRLNIRKFKHRQAARLKWYDDVMEHKKLYRSEKNKFLAGICGGLGEFFNIDATLIRVIWLLVVIFTGIFPGVIAYIFGIFIIPPAPDTVEFTEVKPE